MKVNPQTGNVGANGQEEVLQQSLFRPWKHSAKEVSLV
jgi:hypothetical protein